MHCKSAVISSQFTEKSHFIFQSLNRFSARFRLCRLKWCAPRAADNLHCHACPGRGQKGIAMNRCLRLTSSKCSAFQLAAAMSLKRLRALVLLGAIFPFCLAAMAQSAHYHRQSQQQRQPFGRRLSGTAPQRLAGCGRKHRNLRRKPDHHLFRQHRRQWRAGRSRKPVRRQYDRDGNSGWQ